MKHKELPALDDALARQVGDFESLDALQSTVRKDLEESARRDADANVRQKLLDEIASANPFAVPPSWVNQLVEGYVQAYRVPDEERDRFAGEFRPIAERQVRRDLIIDTIAESEGLRATEADLDDRIAELAKKRNAEPGQVYASLQKAGRLKEIEHGLTEEKVFKWLLERNTVE
jgi:trigger factor